MGKLTRSELLELLDTAEVAVLCTVDGEGKPEGSPVWFEHRRGKMLVHVATESKKARNIRSNPNVSLTLDTRTPPYRGVVLHGTARIVERDAALAGRIAHRYLGRELGEAYLEATAADAAESVLLQIEITSKYTWDYSKGL